MPSSFFIVITGVKDSRTAECVGDKNGHLNSSKNLFHSVFISFFSDMINNLLFIPFLSITPIMIRTIVIFFSKTFSNIFPKIYIMSVFIF